jgi:uncharacterized glyoxalase superfamily protein PhnB
MIERTMFVLAVPNLEVSGAFYRDALGFEIFEMAAGWKIFKLGSCVIMAGECPDAMPAGQIGDHSYFGYFVVDNVDDLYQRAVQYGATIVKSLRDEPWGMREFGLRTVDEHRIMIGQDLKN